MTIVRILTKPTTTHLPHETFNDNSIVISYVIKNGLYLQYVPNNMMTKAVVLAAVKNCGRALEFARSEHRTDKEVVLHAVQEDGLAISYASQPLKNDKQVALAAVQSNGFAIRFLTSNLREDDDVVSTAVKNTPFVYKYLNTRKSSLVALCAFQQRCPTNENEKKAMHEAIATLNARIENSC